MKHIAKLILIILAIVPFVACDGTPRWLENGLTSVGLVDAPLPPAEHIDILVDPTPGSTGNRTSLEVTLEVVLQRVATRPGSSLRVWIVTGEGLEDTILVGSTESLTSSSSGGARARMARAHRWIAENKRLLLSVADPYLQDNSARHSPLLEGMTKVALASSHRELKRRIVLVSDGRPVSKITGDWECALATGDVSEIIEQFQAAGVLPSGSLRNTHVTLSFYTMGAIEGRRCEATLGREQARRRLWDVFLREAGATSVTFEIGPPTFAEVTEGDE